MASALAISLHSCAPLPKASNFPSTRIQVEAGPEDILLDDHFGTKRILISCSDHRCHDQCPNGNILAYTPSSQRVDTLERIGEPEGMVFRPHGFDLVTVNDSLRLFVISHDNPNNHHFIAEYFVGENSLTWLRNIESPHFRSPNALSVSPEGVIYVSNDAWKRGAFMELALAQRKSKLVMVPVSGEAKVVAEKIAFGNGITQDKSHVYQATTTGNKVFAYPKTAEGLGERKVIAKLRGGDNLRWDGGDLLVACHLRGLAFMKHAKNASKKSPSTVYRIHTNGTAPELLYADRGNNINANSTALIVDGKLYVAQVFGPFLLEVTLPPASKP